MNCRKRLFAGARIFKSRSTKKFPSSFVGDLKLQHVSENTLWRFLSTAKHYYLCQAHPVLLRIVIFYRNKLSSLWKPPMMTWTSKDSLLMANGRWALVSFWKLQTSLRSVDPTFIHLWFTCPFANLSTIKGVFILQSFLFFQSLCFFLGLLLLFVLCLIKFLCSCSVLDPTVRF